MAKYLATSLAMENVVNAPRTDQELFADLDDLDQLGRIWSSGRPCFQLRVRPACRLFIATPTSACASAGASLVPSPQWRRSSPPFACSSRISRSLSSGVACARKSSTPASAAMAAAVIGLSPVIMTVRMPMRRNSAKRSRMPPLTMSMSSMTPSNRLSFATASGVRPISQSRRLSPALRGWSPC